MKCFSCGGPLRLVRAGLYRCRFCGQLNEDRGSGQVLPRRMEVYPRIEQVREAAVEGVYEGTKATPSEGGLNPDMVTFVNRTIETLIPIYPEDRREERLRALNVRGQFKRELVEVLEGKRKFQDWYDATRQSLNKRSDQMDEIIYNALGGLSDRDAIELRNMFEQKIRGGVFR